MHTLMGVRPRELVGELMDDPALKAAEHRRALRGLARVNAISRSAHYVWRGLVPLLRGIVGREARVLDLASGGGDVTCGLQRIADGANAAVRFDGCDISRLAVDTASQAAALQGLGCKFIEHDLSSGALPSGYDAMVCTLFLHHLETDAVADLLGRMADACGAVVVDDLRRSRLGEAAAWLGTRGLSRSRVVHVDGPRSVRAAFTPGELRALAERAGMRGTTISRHFPFRMQMTWSRDA